jgi:ABC-type phosphate/phosphonate transport system substrate-binding protein
MTVAAGAPVAALPMYDWPDLRAANDALWGRIAARLRAAGWDAPTTLTRGRPLRDLWRDPDLLLAQTCGHPFVAELQGAVRLVATPVYAAAGCRGPLYSSALVARAGEAGATLADFRGRRAAVNGRDSQSGHMALARAAAATGLPRPFFCGAVETGSHAASIAAVGRGEADIAAIDAVCWALAARHMAEEARRLRVVAWTPLTPGLPFVTAASRGDGEVALLRRALQEALRDPATEGARRALLLDGVAILAPEDYRDAYGAPPEPIV